MYIEVIEQYKNGKGISYSPTYLDQRDLLRTTLNTLVKKYPFLESAYDNKFIYFQLIHFQK